MRRWAWFLLCITLPFLGSCNRSESKARRLYVQAYSAVREAEAREPYSYVEVADNYTEAVGLLDQLVTRYPGTSYAEAIARDDLPLGSKSVSELRQSILPQMQALAIAEKDPLAAAWYLARSQPEPELLSLALQLAEDGKDEHARNFIELGMRSDAEASHYLHAAQAGVLLNEQQLTDRALFQLSTKLGALSQEELGQLILVYLHSDCAAEAIGLLPRFEKGPVRAKVLSRLDRKLGADGLSQALQMSGGTKEVTDYLMILADHYAKQCRTADASKVLRVAESRSAHCHQESERINRLANCAQIWLDLGAGDEAEARLDEAFQIVCEAFVKVGVHPQAIADLALVYTDVDLERAALLWEAALAEVQEVTQSDVLCEVLTQLALVAAKVGEHDSCQELLGRLPSLRQLTKQTQIDLSSRLRYLERMQRCYEILGWDGVARGVDVQRVLLERNHRLNSRKQLPARSELMDCIDALVGLDDSNPQFLHRILRQKTLGLHGDAGIFLEG